MNTHIGGLPTHTPPHIFQAESIYMITALTYRKLPHLDSNRKKAWFCETLFMLTRRFNWNLEAWCVLSNHYHIIARSPADPNTLSQLIRSLHSKTARFINQVDGKVKRKVWFNYWDTCLTNEKSYLARLKYVHLNALKHGLVDDPAEYPFCSFGWWMKNSTFKERERILNFPIDRLEVEDQY